MVLMTYHNPLAGVSFRVIGLARNTATAKDYLRHYYSGVPFVWEEITVAETYTVVRWIDKGAGICYVIQEVEVFS